MYTCLYHLKRCVPSAFTRFCSFVRFFQQNLRKLRMSFTHNAFFSQGPYVPQPQMPSVFTKHLSPLEQQLRDQVALQQHQYFNGPAAGVAAYPTFAESKKSFPVGPNDTPTPQKAPWDVSIHQISRSNPLSSLTVRL